MKPNNLAEAERLFAETRAAVERQHEIIDALVRDGHPTGEALVELAGLTDALLLLLKDLEKERALVTHVPHQPLGEGKPPNAGLHTKTVADG
jgi:hypothetical protein